MKKRQAFYSIAILGEELFLKLERLTDPERANVARSEGTRLTTYIMDMPSPNIYRMTKLAEISMYENVEQFISVPNIIMKLLQLKVNIFLINL